MHLTRSTRSSRPPSRSSAVPMKRTRSVHVDLVDPFKRSQPPFITLTSCQVAIVSGHRIRTGGFGLRVQLPSGEHLRRVGIKEPCSLTLTVSRKLTSLVILLKGIRSAAT